jgi:hypothetical protein
VVTLAALLAGCSAPPPGVEADLYPLARGPLEVEILDAWFVRVEERRLAREEFVYSMRTRCRAWAADHLAAPHVHLTWAEGFDGRPVALDLIEQLRLAGVRQVRAGS